MALVKCKDCDKEVSTEAKTCPHCGAPMPKEGMGWFATSVMIVGGLVAAFLIFGAMQPETPRSVARERCDKIKRLAYTAAEKRAAEDVCAELMRDADRKWASSTE